jgi:hypothetical protein
MRQASSDSGALPPNGAAVAAWSGEDRKLRRFERWLQRHADKVAVVLAIVGLVTRLRNATSKWLDPDEALHFLIANQPSLAAVYRDSLTNAHPPLFYFVLHFWMRLGDSEVSLRLLSVLAGAATVWVVYRWLARFSPAWGLSTALLFATLAPLAALEAEVREYSLVILLMAATLGALERAMADWSPAEMSVSALLLYGAILTHYCTLFFALALGAVALIRVRVTRPGRRFVLAWAATQAGAAALYLFLFLTHVSRIRGGGMDQDAHTGWLRSCFFDAAHDSLVRFIVVHTGSVFAYIFGSKVGGVIGVLLFLVGVTLLLIRRGRPRGKAAAERYLSLTALLTFALTAAGAVASLFPYGGTRHVAFLAVFALPLACVPIVWAARGRLGITLLVVALAAVGFRCLPRLGQARIPGGSQRRELMVAAINAFRHEVPKGAPVLVDYQTSMLLGYYLRNGGVGPFPSLSTQPAEVPLGGYRMLVWARWNFDAASFESAVRGLASTGALRAGQRVWVVDAGAGPQLTSHARTFGENIAIFTVEVPAPRSAGTSQGTNPT